MLLGPLFLAGFGDKVVMEEQPTVESIEAELIRPESTCPECSGQGGHFTIDTFEEYWYNCLWCYGTGKPEEYY